MPKILKKRIASYEAYTPIPYRMLAISLPLVAMLWLSILVFPSSLQMLGIVSPLDMREIERLTFTSYMLLWTVMWALYFASGGDSRWVRAQSLRRLLRETSAEWETHGWDDDPSFYETDRIYYDEMSARSLTATAVMVTATLIVLAQVNAMVRHIGAGTPPADGGDQWRPALLAGAGLSGILAFIGFVLALDLLDSIFIRYRSKALKTRLQHRFFRLMVNRRYPALVALLTATIFLVAYWSPSAGCLVVGIYFGAGYRNWFPSFREGRSEQRLELTFRLLTVFLVVLPIGIRVL